MSNLTKTDELFFERAGLDRQRTERIVAEALQGCDDGELFLEYCQSESIAFDDGRVVELRAGELFYIPPIPHDSWVIGDEPYVSLHFLGAEKYAKKS